MRRIRFRVSASRDLRSISSQSRDRWGTEQAASYVDALRRDLKSLVEFAPRCPVHHDGAVTLRKMPSGHHLVFHLASETHVEVVRVLHERMDAGKRLPALPVLLAIERDG